MLNRDHHNTLLQDLLRKIFSNRTLAPILAFKGGTAMMMFHSLDRFSTDLDFDLLNNQVDSKLIDKQLRSYAQEFGTIKEANSANGKESIRIVVSYADDLTRNIKLDVSKRDYGSNYEIKNLLGLDMKVMVKEDIFAHKLVATTDRINRTNRDLYDLYFMFENGWKFNEEIIRTRLNKSFKDYLPELISHIQSTDTKHILSGLGDLIDKEKKDWVKNKLVPELVYKLEQLK